MRKVAVAAVALVLVSGLSATPAQAGRKPVTTVLYLHGDYPVGDFIEWITMPLDAAPMQMDPTEPAAGPPKSMTYSPVIGKTSCAGNQLFPTWEGRVAGTITSDVKLTATFVAPPSQVRARLWLDVPYGEGCVGDYKPPVAEATIAVPPGRNEVEIVLKGAKGKKVGYKMMLELDAPAQSQGRVMYDSRDFATALEFTCVPFAGDKTCT